MSVQLTAAQAAALSPQNRNAIYTALLSGPGIQHIEQTLSHELQRSGWIDSLKAYITQLLRSGECTTIDELIVRVKAKAGLEGAASTSGTNGVNGANGVVNGVNGINGNGGHEGEEADLKLPENVVRQGSRTIRRELERVCEIGDPEGA